jgi:tRNA U34 5-carboxymethylaminomethyl modifying GTPase MnmE/TrmE
MDDTIAAISTSLGVGAISIIRVSGNDAIKIANKIFKGVDYLLFLHIQLIMDIYMMGVKK